MPLYQNNNTIIPNINWAIKLIAFFLEAKLQYYLKRGFPLYVQMLRQRTKTNASSSITTSIGASLQASSVSATFPNTKLPD